MDVEVLQPHCLSQSNKRPGGYLAPSSADGISCFHVTPAMRFTRLGLDAEEIAVVERASGHVMMRFGDPAVAYESFSKRSIRTELP